jgi:drug/metabolite transporter (DMT)-like permease
MGALLLAGYIATIGVATFLLKVSTNRDLSPYQINFLMAIGMLITGVPALWLAERSLMIPRKLLPLGALVGLLMAIGSILYILALDRLSAGLASAIATAYVVVVVVLSVAFLDESFDRVKLLGLILTMGGVALLSSRS